MRQCLDWGVGAFEAPLFRKLSIFKNCLRYFRTTKLSDFPKMYLGTFETRREVYVNIDVTMATRVLTTLFSKFAFSLKFL